jgi:predicted ester cyclase
VDASKLYDEFECYIDKGFVQIERSDEGLNPECVAHMYSDDIYFQVSRLVMDGEKIIAILEFHYLRTSSDVFSQTSTRRRLNTLFYQLRDKLRTRK